ncbi:MAG: hypothetical protein AABW85_01065 [archaeon]
MEMSYDEVRKIHRFEKNTSQLMEVAPDFYEELHAFLKLEKQKYLESLKTFSIAKTRDFTNLKKMVEEIFSLREKKILNRALIASRTKEVSEENLTAQEKKVFKKLIELLEQHNAILHDLFETDEFPVQKRAFDADESKIEILDDVPSFVGYDMKEYGPFSKGDVVSVPPKIGKLLSSRKLGLLKEQGG